VKYRKLKGYKYELLDTVRVDIGIKGIDVYIPSNDIDHPYVNLWPNGELFIFKDYAWDGPSGPAIHTKTFMRGSLIHDALYQLMREGLLARKYREKADLLLKKICLEDGMNKFRAWYVYQAVRLFAKKSSLPRKKPRGRVIDLKLVKIRI
jgi:hypothetical protein